MSLALIVAVALLPDWSGSGRPRPLWLIGSPIGLGLVGALCALRTRHYGWALLAAGWGFIVIEGLIVIITFIGGP